MCAAKSMTLGWDGAYAPVWESAFKIVEAPMHYLNNQQNIHGNGNGCFVEFFKTFSTSFERHFNTVLDGCSQRHVKTIGRGLVGFGVDIKDCFVHLYDKKHLVVIVLSMTIVFPLTGALTPVSIVIDIFAGFLQAGIRKCQGADKEEIRSILYKKVIVSPVQQTAYFITSIVALSVCTLAILRTPSSLNTTSFTIVALFCSAIGGNELYCYSQRLVAEHLPKSFRPDGYNIFTAGGATDHLGRKANFNAEENYRSWRERFDQEFSSGWSKFEYEGTHGTKNTGNYEKPIPLEQAAYLQALRNTEKELIELQEARMEQAKGKNENELEDLQAEWDNDTVLFQDLITWYKGKQPAYTLFEFDPTTKVTTAELKRRYNKLVLIYHPDKLTAQGKGDEATIWFKMIFAANHYVTKCIDDPSLDKDASLKKKNDK